MSAAPTAPPPAGEPGRAIGAPSAPGSATGGPAGQDVRPGRLAGARAAATRHPVGIVWLGVVLFSTGPVLVAGSGISGIEFSFWRLWCGVVVMGVALLVRRRKHPPAATRVGWKWALISGVAFAFHQIAFMTALRTTSVVDVTLMNTLAPIVVAVLAVPLFGERPGVRFRVWSAVAMVGAAGVVVAGSTGTHGDPWGMALAASNVVFYAFYFVGSKLARPHIEPVPFLAGAVLSAAVTVSLFALVTTTALTPIDSGDLLRCVAVALLPGAVGHFSVTWALRWVPANVPPVIMLTIPILSGALAWIFVGQVVHGGQVIAGLVTLVAVLGAVRSPSAHRLAADEALTLAEES